MVKHKGYLIPDDPSPLGVKCIRVYVPDDDLYLAAFWGGYEYFTSWVAWERDPMKRGKAAAAVWKVAFDIARSNYESGNFGGCGVVDVRQSPIDPCILEKTFDDGVTWIQFAKLSLCNEVAVTPPYPGGGGELPGSDAAVEGQVRILTRVNGWRDAGHSSDLTKRLLVAWLESHAVANYILAVNDFVDAVYAVTSAEVDTVVSTADWQSIRDDMYCGGGVDEYGNVLNSGATSLTNGLNQISADLTVLLNASAAALTDGLNTLAAKLSGGGVTNMATEWVEDGAVGGVGFGASPCNWSHTFDFTVSDHGWNLYSGEYVTSEGFKTLIYPSGGDDASGGAWWETGLSTIYQVSVEVDSSSGLDAAAEVGLWYWSGSDFVKHDSRLLVTGVRSYTWTPNAAFTRLLIHPYSLGTPTITLRKATVSGTGVDPFI